MTRPAILTRPAPQGASQQNLLLFRIYVGYRSLLSIVLLIMLVSPNTRQLVGVLNPSLYVAVALAYLATSALLLGSLAGEWRYNQRMLFVVFFIDIVAIVLMTDASGGMESGLPVLLVITVAAAAVMIPNRTLATLIAALSVLAILADTVWLVLRGTLDINALFPVGLLGLLVFGVSLMVQFIASRLGKAEELARSRASDLYNLQRLNEQIVQHMQTGILLVSENSTVRVMNKAASVLLSPERPITMEQGRRLLDYSEDLAHQFKHWRDSGQHRAQPFRVMESAPPVIAHFRELRPGTERETLVFIEDYTPVTQYAQSLKLNSLGRLTASIAHEIRNPLGAISHAAQLLLESPGLAESDRRLADIIQHHSQRVNQTVESVMQISRREPPRPEYIPLCQWLPDFVGNYLDGLRDVAEITVDCSYLDLLVEFDQENLQRILGNLLDNALRHSKMATGREQARIEVALDFGKNQCLIDIVDHGTGVPLQERSKLFEPFYTTVQEGSGMGLFLCKELCEINNADLYYRTTEQGESCFRVALNQREL
ncbi:HAMP domain-containing sensor histidine kinase [Haliea sp. E1-2-M8]|uniref:sensor histidine kinase n=1 Tax=Haliea sp. E1-2-M8 TaxID=3064706 RepID=UPI00271D940A|nr:sensor histidine kinase [Haliea sp. E1-2-M8]MDO8862477.1 HAMP domain-containing sensor histidine kinase [Haliea sp. E1-2-M8]